MKLLVDTDILISNITEAFSSLDTTVGSLPVWEIELSALEASLQAFAVSLQESVDLVKDIQFFPIESPESALPPCIEGHPLVQTLLIMTIHYHSDLWVNNSNQYSSLNYSTLNQKIWI